MTEKIISYKKYIEPIPETFEAVDFVPENQEEPIATKSNHIHRKIKKKAKTDNNIYDNILISNTEPKVTQNTQNTITEPTQIQETGIPRVVKVTPRAVMKKKKGH